MKAYLKNLPLQIKFMVPMITVLSILLVSALVYLPIHHKHALSKTYMREATKTAKLFEAGISFALSKHSFELLQKTLEHARIDENICLILLLDENGDSLASYNPQEITLSDSIITESSFIDDENNAIIVKRVIFDHNGNKLGRLLLGFSLENVNQQIKNVRLVTIISTTILFLLGLFLVGKTSKRIAKSIFQLDLQMQNIINKGSYSSNVLVSSNDEIGRLAASFNRMMEELRSRHHRLVKSQERYRTVNKKLQELNRLKSMFVSNASHYLRTPLTIIKGELEITLQRDRKPLEYRETLRIIEQETEYLGKTVGNLLTLAKADTGNLVVLQDAINYSSICENQVEHALILAKNKNIVFNYKISKNCFIQGDPNRLSEVIANLLENAVKYTPTGHTITVTLEGTEESIVLIVTDTGIGISEDAIDKIFDQFYRGENPSIRTKGTGLGLAICETIVKAHGGTIRVTSTPRKGTTFEVRLKRLELQSKLPANTDL